jgi:hypothetical protein
VSEPLEFEDGQAWLVKTDILKEIMYFSYEKGSLANVYALDAEEVHEIIKMNRNGIKPESLKTEPEPYMPEFITAVGDDSITRFDNPQRKRSKSRRKGGKGGQKKEEAKAEAAPKGGGQRPEGRRDDRRGRGRRGSEGRKPSEGQK